MIKACPLLSLIVLTLSCCSREELYHPMEPSPLRIAIPDNFPAMQYDLESNSPTEEGFALGKKLFYDGRLSSNGVISCGFCHEQAFSFTHHGHTVSHGVDGRTGFRNAQPLQNLAFFKEFTWDGAAIHLDLQPVIPLTSEVEMNETIPHVLDKLRNDKEYPELFEKVFGDKVINSERMLKALSQFLLALVSGNSPYDHFVRGESTALSQKESDGLRTFGKKCAKCHTGDLFSDETYRNNGLPPNQRFPDEKGRMRVTENKEDYYKFRVPSLRNITKTYPYMHDGRFGTLEDVLNFNDNGMVDNGNVDPVLYRPDGSMGISLNTYEKESIIAFLSTLTDNDFIHDKRFAEY